MRELVGIKDQTKYAKQGARRSLPNKTDQVSLVVIRWEKYLLVLEYDTESLSYRKQFFLFRFMPYTDLLHLFTLCDFGSYLALNVLF